MGTLITDGFDAGDDEKVVSILNKWKDGPLSDNLFTSISKLTPQIGTVIVVFRENNNNKTETLLLPRPADDSLWPGMLNLPGKMLRVSDYDREDSKPQNGPLERIQSDEIKISVDPIYAGIAFQNTLRGPIVVMVHYAVVQNSIQGNSDWTWCEVEKLDKLDNLVKTEIIAVETAYRSYSAGSNHFPSL